MKKKIYIVISLFTMVLFAVLLIKHNNKSELYKDNLGNDKVTKEKDMLSMMLETGAGSGQYEMVKQTAWPTLSDGYLFNIKLSKCENGSELSWDNNNNTVLMSGNVSDKCYIYFDVIPNIDVNFTGSTSSILKINVTNEDGSISNIYDTYYYSVDGGVSYVSSSDNTYSVNYTVGTIPSLSVYASVNSINSPNIFTKKVFNEGIIDLLSDINCTDNICGYKGENATTENLSYYYKANEILKQYDNMNGYLFNDMFLTSSASNEVSIIGSGSNDYYVQSVGKLEFSGGKFDNWKNLYINGEDLVFNSISVDNVSNLYINSNGRIMEFNGGNFGDNVSNLYINSNGGSMYFNGGNFGDNVYISATNSSIDINSGSFGDTNGTITFNLNGTIKVNFFGGEISGDSAVIKVTGNSNVLSGTIKSFGDLSSDGVTFLKNLVNNISFSVTTLSFDFNGFTFTLDEAKAYINSLS